MRNDSNWINSNNKYGASLKLKYETSKNFLRTMKFSKGIIILLWVNNIAI